MIMKISSGKTVFYALRKAVIFSFFVSSFTIIGGSLFSAESSDASHLFPCADELKPAVEFWKKIYSEYSIDQTVIHDHDRLDIIYEVIDWRGRNLSRKAKSREIRNVKNKWREIIKNLQSGKTSVDKEGSPEKHVADMFGLRPGHAEYRRAAYRLRAQQGLKEKFKEGLIRSGRYWDYILDVLKEEGIPAEIAYLPHVESSFNPAAYSKYGAAGLWQFTHSTGKMFLNITYEVDERRDPFLSSRGAARLLKKNYAELKTWPLALTAYNHGFYGMKRAVRKLKTRDICYIIKHYRSRLFGFASRNFYAEFLAAKDVAQNSNKYFGEIIFEPRLNFDEFTMPHYVSVSALSKALKLDIQTIRELNPHLRPVIFSGEKRIPRGFKLRVPRGTLTQASNAYEVMPDTEKHDSQIRSLYYKVKRGDTLSAIASREGTTVAKLMAYNNLSSPHRIYAGQTLKLPWSHSHSAISDTGSNRQPNKAEKRENDSVYKPQNINIKIQPDETANLIADWAGISIRQFLAANGLRSSRSLRVDATATVPLKTVSVEQFERKRTEYHQEIKEDFFSRYKVEGTKEHRVSRGENPWHICHRIYDIPLWLLKEYNAGQNLNELHAGTVLSIPIVIEK